MIATELTPGLHDRRLQSGVVIHRIDRRTGPGCRTFPPFVVSSPACPRGCRSSRSPGDHPGKPNGLEDLIRDYGYLAIVVITFFEGETIVILAGVAAAAGHLDASGVIAAALAGSVSGDQLWYLLGRRFGPTMLARRPGRWVRAAHRMLHLLQRHERWFVLTFRFYYGLRAVAPFAIGAAGVAPLRFLLLNVVGALVWAITFTAAGYLVGDAVVELASRLGLYGTLAVLATLAVTVIAVRRARARCGRHSGPGEAPLARFPAAAARPEPAASPAIHDSRERS